MSQVTTIKLKAETKEGLDRLKIHKRQSYDEVLTDLLLNEAKKGGKKDE